ncbi:MAG TPA: TetR/AcrR family transcriptional regulator [Micromonosporaceae bacterium]
MKSLTPAQVARQGRERRIVETAREIAEADGWPAVTVRRLADAIGYSQPVLYGHFPDGRDGILRAVAMDGFVRLAERLADAGTSIAQVVERYLTFARQNPATYDAMFSMPIDVPFGTSATPAPLRASFTAIERVVAGGSEDRETEAELLWCALHGVAELSRRGRLRPSHERARVDLLVRRFG